MVLLLVIAAPVAAGLGAVQRTDPVNYLPSAAQSTALLRELAGFPGGDTAPAVLVYARPGGLTAANRERIDSDRAAVPAHVTGASQPGPVQRSQDGAAALFTVDLPSKNAVLDVAVPQLRRLTAQVADAAASPGSPPGLSVAVTGPAGYTADVNAAAAGIDGTCWRPPPRSSSCCCC
jgi:RND superfamily putative drug exporter